MKKEFNIFLILILFFNFLFFNVNDTFATLNTFGVGPRDRIRKFEQLNYTYDTTNGFSCKPNGLVFFSSSSETDGWLADLNKTEGMAIAISYDIIANLFLAPLLCVGIMKSIGGGITKTNSFVNKLTLLASVVGGLVLSNIENEILGEDDFNVDMYNPYCAGISASMIAACLVLSITMGLNIPTNKKVAAFFIVNALVYGIKLIYKTVQYTKANAAFNKISLCGDNWLTYGDGDLEDAINSVDRSDNKITINNISKVFPSRGVFFGSYKYDLIKCFQEKNIKTCRKIFNNNNLALADIDSLASINKKQYREFVYDGAEYANTNCKDPRDSRQYFSGTATKNSQLYYFRGNDEANFACDRFLEKHTKEFREAYRCCIEASQKYICIRSYNGNITSTTSDAYTLCDKDASNGTCEIRINYTENNEIDNAKICEDLESNLKKQKENINNQLGDVNCNEGDNELCKQKKVIDSLKCVDGNLISKDLESEYNYSTSSIENKNLDNGSVIKFKIKKSDQISNKYCVETYNLCPYNFKIMGGTENYSNEFYPYTENVSIKNEGGVYIENTKSTFIATKNKKNNCTIDKDGFKQCNGPCYYGDSPTACYSRPANFCQIDRHCVTISDISEPVKNQGSPYVDKACLDLVGSSHNFDNYINGGNSRNSKLLTAPIVECTVETFKNILFNRAGHTGCTNPTEISTDDKTCDSGILYTKGDDLNEDLYPNSFNKIRIYFMRLVKVLLLLAVLVYGYDMILFAKRRDLENFTKFLLTLWLVVYFSLSGNWVKPVFNGLYTIYNSIAKFSMEIALNDKDSINYDNSKYSGCYFFKSNYINNKYSNYGDREYLAVFDTLDCKVARYFGYYTSGLSNPPILSMVLMGIFTFGLGLVVVLPYILIFLSLLFFCIKTTYLFICSSLKLTLLLFLSPMIIPLALFKKTSKIFNNFISNIFKTMFVPMFLFMAMALFFTIFDKYYVKDAVFYGEREPMRDVYCGIICKISDNNFYYVSEDTSENKSVCMNDAKGEYINLKYKSPICSTQLTNKQTNSSFSIINILIKDFKGFPTFGTQVVSFFTLFLDLMFLLLLLYLFEQFLNYISSMNSSIFDGDDSDFKTDGLPSLKDVMKGASKFIAGFANSTKNVGKGAAMAMHNKRMKNKSDKALRTGIKDSDSNIDKDEKDESKNEVNLDKEIIDNKENENSKSASDESSKIDSGSNKDSDNEINL